MPVDVEDFDGIAELVVVAAPVIAVANLLKIEVIVVSHSVPTILPPLDNTNFSPSYIYRCLLQILRRLKKKQSKGSLRPELHPPLKSVETATAFCDAIVVAQATIGEEKEMKEDAKTSLRNALNTDDFNVESMAGNFMWVICVA